MFDLTDIPPFEWIWDSYVKFVVDMENLVYKLELTINYCSNLRYNLKELYFDSIAPKPYRKMLKLVRERSRMNWIKALREQPAGYTLEERTLAMLISLKVPREEILDMTTAERMTYIHLFGE